MLNKTFPLIKESQVRKVSWIKSGWIWTNIQYIFLTKSTLSQNSMVYLDGVDGFCWGSRIWRVWGLIHRGRSWRDDRNLKTERVKVKQILLFKMSSAWLHNQCWPFKFDYLLVWAQVGQEQCWVAIAGTLGELRRFEHCTLVNQKSNFKLSSVMFTQHKTSELTSLW